MPNLEYYSEDKNENKKGETIIELKKSTKLKVLYSRICDFFEIGDDTSLEYIRFNPKYDTNNHSEIDVIKRVFITKKN